MRVRKAESEPGRAEARRDEPAGANAVLALQRMAGNRATTALISRQHDGSLAVLEQDRHEVALLQSTLDRYDELYLDPTLGPVERYRQGITWVIDILSSLQGVYANLRWGGGELLDELQAWLGLPMDPGTHRYEWVLMGMDSARRIATRMARNFRTSLNWAADHPGDRGLANDQLTYERDIVGTLLPELRRARTFIERDQVPQAGTAGPLRGA
jgi:hypothetical protein